jgi:nucleoid DNA-binding protein
MDPLVARNIRVLSPNGNYMTALMILVMFVTKISMVVAFIPLESHAASSTRIRRLSLNDAGLLQQRLYPPAILKSTPTEESDVTGDLAPSPSTTTSTTTTTASKAADSVTHFLKPDFIDAIQKKTGMNKKESENLYKIFFDIITEQLLESANTDPASKMKIPKFGTFYIKLRPERIGKNPRSGEPITIAASKIPSFTPASTLKDLLNGRVKSPGGTKKKNGDDDDDDDDDEGDSA